MFKRTPNTTPQWMRWAVLAFVLYAGYLHFQHRNDIPSPVDGAASGTTVARPADTTTPTPGVSVGGDIAGVGDPASCGQTAMVEIAGTRPDGTAITPLASPMTLPVGVPQPDAPWAPAVAGMKKGGVREVTMLASAVYGKDKVGEHNLSADSRLRYKLELKDLTPATPPGNLPFRASDLVSGHGDPARCGNDVKVHLQVWKADGTPGFSTRADNGPPVTVSIGQSANFYGLDRGLINMRAGALRSLIVPPNYLHPGGLPNTDPRLKAIASDTVALIDLELVEILDSSKKTP